MQNTGNKENINIDVNQDNIIEENAKSKLIRNPFLFFILIGLVIFAFDFLETGVIKVFQQFNGGRELSYATYFIMAAISFLIIFAITNSYDIPDVDLL